MDAELEHTSLGESFERQPAVVSSRVDRSAASTRGEPTHANAKTKRSHSESRRSADPGTQNGELAQHLDDEQNNEEQDEELPPIDLDLNLMRNLLHSLGEQPDALGPFATLLKHAPAAEEE